MTREPKLSSYRLSEAIMAIIIIVTTRIILEKLTMLGAQHV